MIADAPYESRTHPLSPGLGALAGLAAAIIMLLPGLALRTGGFDPQAFLLATGRVLVGTEGSWRAVAFAGSLAVALLGMVGGVLYATSQRAAPLRGLVAVGAFYGLMLWIVARLLVGRMLGGAVHDMMRGWGFLVASEAYALCLAAAAAFRSVRRPATTTESSPLID